MVTKTTKFPDLEISLEISPYTVQVNCNGVSVIRGSGTGNRGMVKRGIQPGNGGWVRVRFRALLEGFYSGRPVIRGKFTEELKFCRQHGSNFANEIRMTWDLNHGTDLTPY